MSEKNPYLKLVMSVLFKNYVDQEAVLAGGKAWIGNSAEFMKMARKTNMSLGDVRQCLLNALEVHAQLNIGTEEGMFVFDGEFCAWNIRQIDSVQRDLPPQTPEDPATIGYIVNLITQEEFVHKKYYEYREKHMPNMPF